MFQTLIIAVFTILCSPVLMAQQVVEWSAVYNSEEEVVVFDAKIEEGWHIYSQNINDGIGPIPTTIRFEENKGIKLIGKVQESESVTKYDPNFEGELSFFEKKASFEQKISIKDATQINATVTFMVCNDTMCLPPEDKLFTISLQD